MKSGASSRKPKQQRTLSRRLVLAAGRGALAVTGLLAGFGVCFFAVAASWDSRVGFPLAVAFAYTVGIATFVLTPGRSSKGYNPFGPVVRAALWPWLRLHLVCVAMLLCGVWLQPWVRAHASPWWLAESGSRRSTWFGDAEGMLFIALVMVEGIWAGTLLTDAELALLPKRPVRNQAELR